MTVGKLWLRRRKSIWTTQRPEVRVSGPDDVESLNPTGEGRAQSQQNAEPGRSLFRWMPWAAIAVRSPLLLAWRKHWRPAPIWNSWFMAARPELGPLLAKKPELSGRTTVCHADGVVTMEDKPSQVMRHGQDTSMWSAINAVKDGRAQAAVSCGNTGALMAVSMLRLRKLPGVNRPAIACLWPSRAPQGFAVMLDVGADMKADAPDLVQYAMMGASYARNGLGLARRSASAC